MEMIFHDCVKLILIANGLDINLGRIVEVFFFVVAGSLFLVGGITSLNNSRIVIAVVFTIIINGEYGLG